MLTGKALLPGKNELEQLDLIFQLCGTPTKETWPGAIEYKDYSKMAPKTFYKRTLREKLKKYVIVYKLLKIQKLYTSSSRLVGQDTCT